jgi:hypothetical protein
MNEGATMTRWLAATLFPVLLNGCLDPQGTAQLDAEVKSVKGRVALAQDERLSYGKGSVMHDLVSLRLAIEEQTLAMLEQRRAAGGWRTSLSYEVNGKPYVAPADADKKAAKVESRIREVRAGRESDLQQARHVPEPYKPLYTMSAGTKAILVAQLEYQLAAYRHGFPPYYVPFTPPAEGAAPPQVIVVPAGAAAVVQ